MLVTDRNVRIYLYVCVCVWHFDTLNINRISGVKDFRWEFDCRIFDAFTCLGRICLLSSECIYALGCWVSEVGENVCYVGEMALVEAKGNDFDVR